MNEERSTKILLFVTGIISLMIALVFLLFVFVSCTISFHNISTEGSATDLIDQQQEADAQVTPNIKVTPI